MSFVTSSPLASTVPSATSSFLGGVLLVAIVAIVGVVALFVAAYVPIDRAARKDAEALKQREAAVQLATFLAAEDDPKFDPRLLSALAERLVVRIQIAWAQGNRKELRRMLGPDLLVEWERRLDEIVRREWKNHIATWGTPRVRVVSILNRTADRDDRVVVHVQMGIYGWVETPDGPKSDPNPSLPWSGRDEFWTLGWRPSSLWYLISIEQADEGAYHLTAPLVATPDRDPELAAIARTELAVDDAAGDGTDIVELVSTSFSDDARAAALDLSLLDDRFSPHLLEIAVDRALAAWAIAIDGPDDALQRLAVPDVVATLLYGDDPNATTRTVVRGPRIAAVAIESVVGGDGAPATMGVSVQYCAYWYREDRATLDLLAGSRDAEAELEHHWRFELRDDDREHPWQLVSAASAVQSDETKPAAEAGRVPSPLPPQADSSDRRGA